ncbi:MAG: MJ0042-type zinc finger domain-containing protein [Pseudomonadota bacterium]
MIITCDVCHTTYHADASTIGEEGRQVKCASCGHTWFVNADGRAGQPRPAVTSAHTSYLRTVHERQVKRSRFAAVGAWAAVFAVAMTLLAGAVINRDSVVQQWPRLASAYTFIGLPVNQFGVEFENVERRRDLVGTVPVLTVAADVRNPGERARQAPRVRIGLLDTHGQRIAEFEADVAPAVIEPGDAGRFEAVMENPPADSYTLDLRFMHPTGRETSAETGSAALATSADSSAP